MCLSFKQENESNFETIPLSEWHFHLYHPVNHQEPLLKIVIMSIPLKVMTIIVTEEIRSVSLQHYMTITFFYLEYSVQSHCRNCI